MKSTKINHDKALTLNVKRGLIAIGDIHLSNSYPYSSSTGKIISDRLLDVASPLEETLILGRKLELPVFVNGDLLLAKTLDYSVTYVLTTLLMRYDDVRIIFNLGNHDLDGSRSILSPLIRYGRNENHAVILEPTIIDGDIKKGFDAFVIPYDTEIQNKIKILDLVNKDINKNDQRYRILFVHNIFRNSKFNSSTQASSGLSQKLFTGGKLAGAFNLIVASDIHRYQEICSGLGFYTSSPIALDFGERKKDHGYHIIDITNDIRYFVIPNAPQFIHVEFDDIDSTDVKNNIIKVIFRKEEQIKMSKDIKKKLIEKGARYVSFKKNIESRIDLPKMKSNEVVTPKSLVAGFSKILAKEKDLDLSRTEKIGMEIFEKAKQIET